MENKTIETDLSVDEYINNIENSQQKSDAIQLLDWMKSITNLEPVMWGEAIVGFGKYHYKYDSGREGDFFLVGFSMRKQNISIHIVPGFQYFQDELKLLGKHKTGVSCLYINKLADVNRDILQSIISTSFQYMKTKYAS